MIKIITGNEPYLIDREKRLLPKLDNPEMNCLRTDKFDRETIMFLNTYPLIDDKRVCFVDIDKQSTLDTTEFREYLYNPCQWADVLILIRNYDQRTKFGKEVSKYITHLDKLTDKKTLQTILLSEISTRGCRITEDAMNMLLKLENYFDSDEVNLLSIIADLTAIMEVDKDITVELVEKYVQPHYIADRFALTKKIKEKDIKGLIRESKLLNSDSLISILYLLLREYRISWKLNFCQLKSVKYSNIKLSKEDSLLGMEICNKAIERIKNGCDSDSLMSEVFIKLCDLG